MNLLWQMDPPVPRQRCLEHSSIHHFWDTPHHFLKTHFCLESGFLSFLELQKSPQYQSRDALHTSTHNMADEPTLADGPPRYQSRDAWNTSAQKVADEPSLANGPPVPDRDAMNTITQNLADEPSLANGPPCTRQRCLEYQYTKLGRWTYFGHWNPQYQSRDDLHTALAFTISEIPHSISSKHIFPWKVTFFHS